MGEHQSEGRTVQVEALGMNRTVVPGISNQVKTVLTPTGMQAKRRPGERNRDGANSRLHARYSEVQTSARTRLLDLEAPTFADELEESTFSTSYGVFVTHR
jgi:hypothetical protein